MKLQTVFIRNMCCQRCIDAVLYELQSLGLKTSSVKLGVAKYEPSPKITLLKIETALNKRGFILLKNEEDILVEKIKTVTLDLIEHLSEMGKADFIFANYLQDQLKVSYRMLSNLFSKHRNMTIEKYFILLKIEKAKDLIENSNLKFFEIAWTMGYKSLQHLSTQFKQVTGVTMHDYKKSKNKRRKALDLI